MNHKKESHDSSLLCATVKALKAYRESLKYFKNQNDFFSKSFIKENSGNMKII